MIYFIKVCGVSLLHFEELQGEGYGQLFQFLRKWYVEPFVGKHTYIGLKYNIKD